MTETHEKLVKLLYQLFITRRHEREEQKMIKFGLQYSKQDLKLFYCDTLGTDYKTVKFDNITEVRILKM